MRRVPRHVKHHHSVSSHEIDPQSSRLCRYEKQTSAKSGNANTVKLNKEWKPKLFHVQGPYGWTFPVKVTQDLRGCPPVSSREKIRVRAILKENTANYVSLERLINVDFGEKY